MLKADTIFNTPKERAPELIEPFSCPDTWTEGLARVDRVGPCRRLLFFGSDSTAPTVRLVVAKLILPADILPTIAQMLAADIHQPEHFSRLHRVIAN